MEGKNNMIKSKSLQTEQILNYKNNIWVNYSMFNLKWMDELKIKPKIIFDVGCNNGGDSIRFKKQWPDAEVHAFEADPTICNIIEEYMEEENINLLNVGVSNEDGELEFYPASPVKETKSVGAWGTFVKSRAENNSSLGFSKPVKVKTISLHTYCQQNNIKKIDLLHIDAEGWDFNVMKGLGSIKTNVIFIEHNPSIVTYEKINEFQNYMKTNYEFQLYSRGCDSLYTNKNIIK